MAMKPFTLRSPEAVFRFISPITSRYPHSPLTAILSKVPSLRNSVEDEVQRICYRAMKYLRSIQNIHSSMSEYFFDADLMDINQVLLTFFWKTAHYGYKSIQDNYTLTEDVYLRVYLMFLRTYNFRSVSYHEQVDESNQIIVQLVDALEEFLQFLFAHSNFYNPKLYVLV